MNKVRGGLPGKLLVIGFSAMLVVVLVVGVPTTLRFAASQDALDSARQAWPAAALRLADFYQTVADSEELDSDKRTALQGKADEFTSAVLFEEQLPIASELEALIANLDLDYGIRSPYLEDSVIAEYLAAEDRLGETRDGYLGSLTYAMLRIPEYPQLKPYWTKRN